MQEHDIEQNFVEIDSAIHEPDPKLLEWAQQPDEEFVDEVPVAEAIVDAVPDELPNAVEEELHDDELAVKATPCWRRNSLKFFTPSTEQKNSAVVTF